jgi:hypothetical protein
VKGILIQQIFISPSHGVYSHFPLMWKIPEKTTWIEESFILSHSFRGFSPLAALFLDHNETEHYNKKHVAKSSCLPCGGWESETGTYRKGPKQHILQRHTLLTYFLQLCPLPQLNHLPRVYLNFESIESLRKVQPCNPITFQKSHLWTPITLGNNPSTHEPFG